MFKRIIQAIKGAIVQPAPTHAEQPLDEFLRDARLPKIEQPAKEEAPTRRHSAHRQLAKPAVSELLDKAGSDKGVTKWTL